MRKSRPEQEPTQRQKRVNEAIRRALSNVMTSGNFFHADFTKFFVNITSVKVSPDLRQVKIYIMALNQPTEVQCANILKALKGENTRLRRDLAKQLTLKFVPHLKFFWDEEVEQADRIESLLRKHTARDSPIDFPARDMSTTQKTPADNPDTDDETCDVMPEVAPDIMNAG